MPWETSNVKMGFEGRLFIGVAGATAATQLTNIRDIKTEHGVNRGKTTVRGDSSAPPIETSNVTSRIIGLEFTMVNDATDVSLETLMQAAANGAGVALRGKDHAAGKGFNADFNISASDPWPLDGEQVRTFTCEPTRSYGREPISRE